MTHRTTCAVLGSGNIGTDLMIKLRRSKVLEPRVVVGIDPESEGLALARSLGVETTADGPDWLLSNPDVAGIVFDATSAHAHRTHAPHLIQAGFHVIDLTPAKLGPGVVPVVNLAAHGKARDVNLISCGGQATIPVVAAVSAVTPVSYAEIVATIASRSAGPGTRQNIDEFTYTTARGLEEIGGASRGKAIIILNPAEPPIVMRNTVYCAITEDADREAVVASIHEMVRRVGDYVPGYRLRSEPIFDDGRVMVFLEIEGTGDYLPAFAGNLDIMTSAAVRVGEELALLQVRREIALPAEQEALA